MPKPELEFFRPDHLPWEPVAASATGGADPACGRRSGATPPRPGT